MFLSSFDIFRKERRGNHVSLAAMGDLETARYRLSQLATLVPGEYFVFDRRTHQIVAAVSSKFLDLDTGMPSINRILSR